MDLDPHQSCAPANKTLAFDDLPAEVLSYIVRLIYLESIPRSHHRNLDLHGLPSTYSDGRRISSPHSTVQTTLWSLCLTSKTLFAHARPLLYRRINVTLPYSFMLLIRTLGAAALATAYERFQVTGKLNQDPNDPESFTSIVAAAGFARVLGTNLRITDSASSLSRSRSQQRRIPSTTSAGEQTDEDELDLVWRPDPLADPNAPATQWTVSLHPLGGDTDALQRCIRVVDFSQFRTQGLRRSIGDGLERRFVTPSRLLALLTAAPDLVAFGASQTMDSSLSVEVLEALLFRGGRVSRPARLRGVSVERRKREEQLSLLALDLTDCVSPAFERAAEEFINRHLRKFSGRRTETVREEEEHTDHSATEHSTESETDDQEAMSTATDDDEEDRRGRQRGTSLLSSAPSTMGSSRSRSTARTRSMSMHRTDSDRAHAHPAKRTKFSSIQRLSMSGIPWRTELLNPFVQAFTRLTHLDLSRTRIDGTLLDELSASSTLQLECLSLAHCRALTSESITSLLVDSPVTSDLIELSLEGSLLFPTNVNRTDMRTIVTSAPCFRSGQLRYLDIGGCGMDDELLGLMRPLPKLLDFGLGASGGISLGKLAQFLRERAPNVQILELTDSCYDPTRNSGVSALDLSTSLIGPCCTTPPLPLRLQLAALGFASSAEGAEGALPSQETPRAPTNLRVIGLNEASLRSVRDGIDAWKVILGSGKRGWVVDTSAGPDPEAKDDDFEADDFAFHSDEDEGSPDGMDDELGRGRDHTVVNRVPILKPALHRQRTLRTGYEPETPPISRHASLSPARTRSPSARRSGSHRRIFETNPASATIRHASGLGASQAWQSHSRSRSRSGISSGSLTIDAEETRRKQSSSGSPVAAADRSVLRPRNEIIRGLPATHPRREALATLSSRRGHVSAEVGWHSRKMEILLGFGLLGRERGNYAFAAYCQ